VLLSLRAPAARVRQSRLELRMPANKNVIYHDYNGDVMIMIMMVMMVMMMMIMKMMMMMMMVVVML
jgi:hypothetical protein